MFNPNEITKNWYSEFENAIKCNNTKLVKRYLSEHKFVPHDKYTTPIIFCVEYGNLEIVKLFVESGYDPHKISKADVRIWATSSMHTACIYSNIEMVMYLESVGVDIDKRLGVTPLHEAIECGKTTIVQYLLERGASPDSSYEGLSLLHLAVLSQDEKSLKLLMKFGADITVVNDCDYTPLQVAEREGLINMAKILSGN